MADLSNRVGQQLGNYRLLRLLGQGGFAEVYLGEHAYLGTHAAIKILYTRVVQDDIAQFQREARMLANLVHPHIVRVLDFGVDDHIPYLVMDYAPGGTLRTRHPRGTRLSVPTVVAYVKQFAQALQYAHDQRLIHRDVKPQNMLIGRNGEMLLTDFGIALIGQTSGYQSTKDMAGTITYMAPEQIEAHPHPASDQYSLGIVAYEWLSGDQPFYGSFTEIAVKQSVTPPPSLCQQLSTLSPEIEQVVFTALAKKPENRFASVRAFATALEQAANRLEQSQQSVSLGEVTLLSQPRQNQLSAFLPLATPSSQSISSAAPMTPPNQIPKLTTETPPLGPSFQRVDSANTELPVPQRKGRLSRRTMITSLTAVGVAASGGGILWWVLFPHLPYIYRGHSDGVTSVAWSPDGNRIVSASWDKTVQVWDAVNGHNVYTYKGHSNLVNSAVWSPDGKHIASGSADNTVQVWHAVDGGNVYTYKGHSNGVKSVAWSPDSKRIASGSADNTVQVWDAVDGGNVYTYKGHSNLVESVAWSPDSKRIASGSADNTVQVWDAVDGGNAYTYKGHSDTVYSVAWSPNSQSIASGSNDKTVQVWHAADGSNTYTYKGHSGLVDVVAWSPDGKRITSGSNDKTVQVWHAANGGNIYIYHGHSNVVNALAWSPDGKRIASGSDDNTVQIWEAS